MSKITDTNGMVPAAALLARLPAIDPVACPCGQARRSLYHDENGLCTLHQVEISENAETHYHKQHTEVYYVLSGEGSIELDGSLSPVSPGTVIMIPPMVKHRAVVEDGERMTILNFVVPPFDPEDEWID